MVISILVKIRVTFSFLVKNYADLLSTCTSCDEGLYEKSKAEPSMSGVFHIFTLFTCHQMEFQRVLNILEILQSYKAAVCNPAVPSKWTGGTEEELLLSVLIQLSRTFNDLQSEADVLWVHTTDTSTRNKKYCIQWGIRTYITWK